MTKQLTFSPPGRTSSSSPAGEASTSSTDTSEPGGRQEVYAVLPFPPLGGNDTVGSMGNQRGFRKPKNARTSRWQDDVVTVLKLSGLKAFDRQEGKRVSVYVYTVTQNRDVDHCVKYLLDAISWALCPRYDTRGRRVYQDSWQGSAYLEKEWSSPGGPETLEVWVQVEITPTKNDFNQNSRERRTLITARMGGDPAELPPLGGTHRKPDRSRARGKV